MATPAPVSSLPPPSAGVLKTPVVDSNGNMTPAWITQWNTLWTEVFGGGMQRSIRIVPPTLLTTGATPLYQSTRNALIQSAAVTNSSAGAATISVYFVPRGAVAGTGNLVFIDSIPVNSTVQLSALLASSGQVLEANESLQASASAANALTLTISGVLL